MKMILKNLWNCRGKYAWLFIELIIITAISWWMLDSAAVSISDTHLPLGYDADRLVVVQAGTLPEAANNYIPDLDSIQKAAYFDTFMGKLRRYPGVERVSPQQEGCILNDQSISVNRFKAGTAGDSISNTVNTMLFTPGTEFFETYGIKTAEGSPSPEELSAKSYVAWREKIITQDYADIYWPGENAVGKHFFFTDRQGDTIREKVAGVINNVRYQTFNRTYCLVLVPMGPLDKQLDTYDIVVRLEEGIAPETFARQFVEYAAKNMTTGNLYVRSVTPYSSLISDIEYTAGITADRNLNIVLTCFFLINLILGVVGSFYLLSRRRVQEIGVRRSFGATRSSIVGMLMGEGIVLATVAFIIGDLLYLQYALKFGLDTGYGNNNLYNLINNWVGNFWEHFAVVSAIVYACIILCVIIGTLLPALEASRVDPVDALRDE